MSKRVQILIITVKGWVRRMLQSSYQRKPAGDPQSKLAAVRMAASYSFPVADIEQMLSEIELGYRV